MNSVYISNFIDKITVIIQNNKRKVLYRRKLFELLTIEEAEKIYTSYISKTIVESSTDFITKKKIKKRIPFWKLKLNIRMKVNNKQMVHCIPRLSEVEY